MGLKKYVHKLKKVGAKLLKNKLTLQKVTGKKADSNSRKPHDINRLEQNIAIIMNRKEKIFNLANRLARNMVFLDYDKAYKLAKAETPKKMTKEQSVHVENLKKKIME